jgi:hypothetical protein
MPNKTILLYDSTNKPLRVAGIRVELFDATTGTYIAGDDSANLDPSKPDPSSDLWGVDLTFAAGTNPLDIMIKDPLYRYPGNTVRYLNGELQDLVYLDLVSLPMHAGGQVLALRSGDASQVVGWIEQGGDWNETDKEAVYNLVFNYIRLVAARPLAVALSPELKNTATNWETALHRVGIDPALFHTRRRGPATPKSSVRPNLYGGYSAEQSSSGTEAEGRPTRNDERPPLVSLPGD